MSALRTAALLVALLALTGCKSADIDAAIKSLENGNATADDVTLVAPDPEPPRFLVLEGTGPMGEEIATGVDCHPAFRARICV